MRTIRATGDFAAVGEAVGEATRDDVRFVREAVVPYLEKETRLKTRESLLTAAQPFFRASERFFPPAFEYLRGVARGAGVAFDELLLVMFDEDVYYAHKERKEKCSTLVVRTDHGWITGHNEDYDAHYRGRLSTLDLAFDGWPRLLAVSYPGKLPGVGGALNAAGIAITNNSLAVIPVEGVSSELRGFRAALSSTPDEALEALATQPSSLPVHFYVISAAGRAVSLEVGNEASSSLPEARSELEGEAAAHTNTVLRLPLKVADGCTENSRSRYAKLERLIADGRTPSGPEEMMRFMSAQDHLLNRAPGDDPNGVTLASVVIRPATGELWVHEEGTADDAVHRHAL